MNSTSCSTATLIGIHVVVGGWKSHVFAIQNTKAAIICTFQDFHCTGVIEYGKPSILMQVEDLKVYLSLTVISNKSGGHWFKVITAATGHLCVDLMCD